MPIALYRPNIEWKRIPVSSNNYEETYVTCVIHVAGRFAFDLFVQPSMYFEVGPTRVLTPKSYK
jgi:hypothetical protein